MKQADAIDEADVKAPGADHDEEHANNADFSAAFDSESTGKEVKLKVEADGALPYEEPKKPAKEKVDKPAPAAEGEKPRDPETGKFVKPEDAKPVESKGKQGKAKEEEQAPAEEPPKKTALELAIAADEPPEGEPEKPAEQAGDIMNALPSQYAWAKQARESGKLVEFLQTQPKAIQKLATTGDLDDALYVLDLYKKAQEPAPAPQPTAKEIKALMAEFGDVKFKAPDGTEKTLKGIADEYGNQELFEAFGALARSMVEKSAPASVPAQPKNDAIDALQQRIDKMAQEQAFWEPVLEAHSDAKRLARNGKIREWVESYKG